MIRQVIILCAILCAWTCRYDQAGSTPVGVTRVDYRANTLTLDSPRSWARAAHVFYYRSDRFRGKAPDIGAHESAWSSKVQ